MEPGRSPTYRPGLADSDGQMATRTQAWVTAALASEPTGCVDRLVVCRPSAHVMLTR
jgi:hypothetical protein